MIRVLFVCLGNICRSPTAHGVFVSLIDEAGLRDRIDADSAGTYGHHGGAGADRRAVETARLHGVDLSAHRAQPVVRSHFSEYDHIFAMDRQNYADLLELCPAGAEHKIEMFLALAPHLGIDEVPDPYYGGASGFDKVYEMIHEASLALVDRLRADNKGMSR